VAVVSKLVQNREETAIYKGRNKTQNNTETHNTYKIEKEKYNKRKPR
jgi:hypothetical protein